jgi:hypothetical protein
LHNTESIKTGAADAWYWRALGGRAGGTYNLFKYLSDKIVEGVFGVASDVAGGLAQEYADAWSKAIMYTLLAAPPATALGLAWALSAPDVPESDMEELARHEEMLAMREGLRRSRQQLRLLPKKKKKPTTVVPSVERNGAPAAASTHAATPWQVGARL